jgi:hypothetical protein
MLKPVRLISALDIWRAYAEREGENLALMNYEPDYKNLRSDPRFSAMLRRSGLPE